MRDLKQMSAFQATLILDGKASELETDVLMAKPGATVTADHIKYLSADLALVAGFLAEFIERFEARLVLLEAHQENLIERVYELEERVHR